MHMSWSWPWPWSVYVTIMATAIVDGWVCKNTKTKHIYTNWIWKVSFSGIWRTEKGVAILESYKADNMSAIQFRKYQGLLSCILFSMRLCHIKSLDKSKWMLGNGVFSVASLSVQQRPADFTSDMLNINLYMMAEIVTQNSCSFLWSN